MTTETPPILRAATATRQGTRPHNADGAAVITGEHGAVCAAVIDGIGSSPAIAAATDHLAWLAARIGLTRGPLAGLLTAGEAVADPGPEDAEVTPDGVAVVALASPGDRTLVAWCGDARAYGWGGRTLTRYTTDHTFGQQLREHGGVAADICEYHDDWVRTTLSRATVGTVREVVIPAGHLVLLTSDGVHKALTDEEIAAIVARHTADPQALAEALVAAPCERDDGYRDDATVAVIAVGAS